MRKFLIMFFAATMIISLAVVSFAADMPTRSSGAKPGAYPSGPIQKAERGFSNALFGWTEIPKSIVDRTKESNPIKGLILGTLQGVCKAFARTVSGIADVATFPIAGYDKPAIIPDMPAAK